MRYLLCLVFFFLIASSNLIAQKNIADSLEQVVKTAIQKKDKLAEATALRDLGLYQAEMGNFMQALENAQQAIDIFEPLNKPVEISKCYRIMMIAHYALHNTDKLQEYAEKSLKIGLEQNDTNIIAHSYSALSIVYNDRKEYKKDLELNLKALKLKEGKPDLSLYYNNLAVSYTGIGDYETAIKYAKLAEEGYKGDTLEVIGSIMNEIRALAMANRVSEAESKMKKIETMVKQYGQHPDERYLHWLNYLILDAKKDYKKALQHFIKYHEMDSVLTSKAHHLQYAQAETAYETKKKEQKNEQLAAQIQKQKFTFGGIGLGLLSLGSFFYFQRNRLKIKNKLLETEQALSQEKLHNAEQALVNYTNSLRERNDAFEKMKADLDLKNTSSERDTIIVQLTQASIMTDEQWRDFRQKFERVYPNFFNQIQLSVPDITESEKRFAALTKLGMTGNEIALMLGVSPESVIKTRYRFRKKLEDGDLIGLLEKI